MDKNTAAPPTMLRGGELNSTVGDGRPVSSSGHEKEKTCPIQVVVRGRALNDSERREAHHSILSYPPGGKSLEVGFKSKSVSKTYTFDHVYGPDAGQEELYERTVSPIVEEVLKGFNCTIFAYGQTGTGKTYTMEGVRSEDLANMSTITPQSGIIPRAVRQIFDDLAASGAEYSVRVSLMELYNEELIDLLNSSTEPLKIFDDAARRGVTVQGVEEVLVKDTSEIFKVLYKGFERRRTAATDLNANSSRSHCIFSVVLHIKEATPDGEDLLKVGKLNLVDLAGSENIGRSGAQNQRKREAGAINQSLLTLGRVITALTEHQPHIPYRESKLTRLLQDSLGGRTKTCIVATVSPSSGWFDETISTLEYAHRAKNIRNKPEVNQKMTKRALIRDYQQEIERLRANLSAARDKNGFFVTYETYSDMESQIQSSKDQILEMENQLKFHETALAQLKANVELKQSELDQKSKEVVETKGQLEQTTQRLNETAVSLEQTKEVLEEKKIVLAQTKVSEQILHKNATQLLTTLNSAVADIEGLHGKVDRKLSVEEENKRKFQLFNRYMTGRTTYVVEQTGRIGQEQQQAYGSLHSAVSSFAAAKDQELSELRASVNAMADVVGSICASFVELTQSHSSSVASSFELVSSAQRVHSDGVQSATAAFLDESMSAVAVLRRRLEAQEHSVTQFADTVKGMLKSETSHINEFATEHKSALRNLSDSVQRNAASQAEQAQARQAAFEQFAAQQQMKTREFEQSLMAKLAEIVSGHVQAQTQAFSQAAADFKAAATSTSDDAAAFAWTYADGSVALESAADSFVGSFGERCDAHYAAIDASSAAQTTALREMSSGDVETLSNRFVGVVSGLERAESEHTARLCRSVETGIDATSAFVGAAQATVSELRSQASEHQANFGKCIDRFAADGQAAAVSISDEIASHRAASESALSGLNVSLAEIKTEAANFFANLKEDKPTGNTPQKKKISYPTALPEPQPEEVLLAMHKRGSTPSSASASSSSVEEPQASVSPPAADRPSASQPRQQQSLSSSLLGASGSSKIPRPAAIVNKENVRNNVNANS